MELVTLSGPVVVEQERLVAIKRNQLEVSKEQNEE